ncbi:MAG: cytochrome c oxidase assembly protein [Alphaproteobacteria bacterium]|nr:cytochrome c oxidase assembly protein [Alphaproteobacteria bacterium]
MPSPSRNHGRLALALLSIVVGMGLLVAASVPLYRIFCQVTGLGGTTGEASDAPAQVVDREVTVRFNADTDKNLSWKFRPIQSEIKVRVGERSLAFFEATNNSDQPVTGTATYNVTPLKVGLYFTKVDCFCFTEQTLQPHQTVQMPVSFFVDPEIIKDADMDDVKTITLSYTFFQAKK